MIFVTPNNSHFTDGQIIRKIRCDHHETDAIIMSSLKFVCSKQPIIGLTQAFW